MAGLNFPIAAIRQQTASSLDLLVHLSRMTGGRRRITSIAELTGMEGSTICLSDLFVFNQTGIDADGHAVGNFEACGACTRRPWNAWRPRASASPTSSSTETRTRRRPCHIALT